MKRWLGIIFVALSLAAGCNGKSGDARPEATILLGEFASMTGKEADFGKSTHDGIMLAVEEINQAGGVLKKKLEVVTGDDQSQNELAPSVVQKLVSQDGVQAVIGEVASSRTMAGAPVCEQNKIPMISPSSTNPDVTVDKKTNKVRAFIFRICFIDPFQGTVMARFASQNLKVKRVGILVDSAQDYSKGLAKYFREEFEAQGGRIVGEESYLGGAKDFRSQLTALKGKKPQALFIPGYYNEAGNIALQTRELGISVPLMGGDGWDSEDLVKIGKDAVQGAYFSNHYSSEDKNPLIQEYVKRFKAKYKKTPNALSALGYDAVRILAQAMKTAGSTGGPAVAKALAGIKGFDGVTGKISINEQHNAIKPAVVLQVKGNKFKYVTTITP